MSKLKEDFPGFAALEAAGEATEAKVRKRIAAGTLTEIPGIGEATAERITEEFEAIDSPDRQARDVADADEDAEALDTRESNTETDTLPEGDKPARPLGAAEEDAATNERLRRSSMSAGPDLRRRGQGEREDGQAQDEAAGPGGIVGQDAPFDLDHDLSNVGEGGAATEEENRKRVSDGERLLNSGYCHYDDPNGPYVADSKAVRIQGTRIKVTPISMMAPTKGLEVRDGEDVYTILEEYHDGPNDWLKVRNPNSGVPLIR